jgi:uroporphyrinogen decarboxylase
MRTNTIVREPLTSRERVLLALDHRETDRVPTAMICAGINPPARRAFEEYLQRTRDISVDAYLDPLIDVAGVGPSYVGPGLAPGQDMWGVRRAPIVYSTGSYGDGAYDEISHHPLAEATSVDDLRAHRWPETGWFDYETLPARIAESQSTRDRCLMVSNGNLFETAWYMRGFERMLTDFVLHPDFAHYLMDRVTDFYVAHFRAMLAAGRGAIDLAFTADDIGDQRGLLMSLPMWEEFIKPRHVRLNAAIHEFGARVVYHTDGAVAAAVPGLMDMGIDVLQALQFSAEGMDPADLKTRHGDQLCFAGGVSVQTTLPFGTPDDVRDEVETLITTLGRGGGYILGPSHAIQAGTPPENVAALFDTAAAYYPY